MSGRSVATASRGERSRTIFDNVIRQLKSLEGRFAIPMPVHADDDGYLDRLCPSDGCGFSFKVQVTDWKEKIAEKVAYCPFCREQATPQEFSTPEQMEYFKQVVVAQMRSRIVKGLQADAASFNRRSWGGWLSMSMRVTASPPSVPLPPNAQKEMTLRISCEQCSCRFAVIGAAYFCPACGHNSASATFAQSLTIARTVMRELLALQASLPDRDTAAQVEKILIEGAFGTLVTAFQRFAEAEYPKLPTLRAPRRNAFQNLSEGSQLWHEAGGRSYESLLEESELLTLTRLFQQRHVLEHCEGIVDQRYLDLSGDKTYLVGQRLVVRERSVIDLADLLDKLVAGMRQDLPGS